MNKPGEHRIRELRKGVTAIVCACVCSKSKQQDDQSERAMQGWEFRVL